MFSLPTHASVRCPDGTVGASSGIIVNPVNNTITYVVVEDASAETPLERLVPIDLVADSTPTDITLTISRAAFRELDVFEPTYYIANKPSAETPGTIYQEPWLTPAQTVYNAIDSEAQVPPDDLSVHRGSQVNAIDGHIGHISHLILDAQSSRVTHLVLEKGHIWGRRQIALPVSAIASVNEKTVTLKLTKEEIGSLPQVETRQGGDALAIQLIVWEFEDEHSADTALKNLQNFAQTSKMKLLNAAVLIKDINGKTHLRETQDVHGGRGALFGAVTGGLIGLIGGPVGVVVGAAAGAATGGVAAIMIDMGFKDDDLRALQANLSNGTSALVAMIEEEWVEQVLNMLSQTGGQLVQQAISDEIVATFLANKKSGRAST